MCSRCLGQGSWRQQPPGWPSGPLLLAFAPLRSPAPPSVWAGLTDSLLTDGRSVSDGMSLRLGYKETLRPSCALSFLARLIGEAGRHGTRQAHVSHLPFEPRGPRPR